MLGVRERLPNPCRRVGEVADENERPLLSIFSDLSARSGTRRVLLTAAHVFSFLSQRVDVPVRSGLARPSPVNDVVLERERASTCPRPFGPQRQRRRPVNTSHGCSSFLSFL